MLKNTSNQQLSASQFALTVMTMGLISLSAVSPAYAADEEPVAAPMFETPKAFPAESNWKTYGGFGISRDLLHANAEVITPWGHAYGRVGQFIAGSGISGQLGLRKLYKYSGVDQNGYYLGGFIGHLFPDHVNDERFNRIGAGGELSYVWQNTNRLNSVSITLGVAKGETQDNGNDKLSSTVVIGFGATMQVPIF